MVKLTKEEKENLILKFQKEYNWKGCMCRDCVFSLIDFIQEHLEKINE